MVNLLSATSILVATLLTPASVEGHGYLKTPRSRNRVAAEDGIWWSGGPSANGTPEKESCSHCLNKKAANNLCSKGEARTLYDNWKDINGNPMPWVSQATYTEGQEITIEVFLTANHVGHMEILLCPDGDGSTQACLEANPATNVRDEFHGGPTDPQYPSRGYIARHQTQFKFTYKLPDGLRGDKVLMQWRYTAANTCLPPNYEGNDVKDTLVALGWLSDGISQCPSPPNPTGLGHPEQFWNCAEVTIRPRSGGRPRTPTISPPVPAPVAQPVPQPVASPVSQPSPSTPSPGPSCCSWNKNTCPSTDPTSWCNHSRSNCESGCSGSFIVPGGDSRNNCLPKWAECTSNVSGCCEGQECKGNRWYRQCV